MKAREVNVLFTVDLFNEGLDLPSVDTVLFLRPTESATVFLQQLGRGLRLAADKPVLTALDFVGHQRKEFRFDVRYRALTGATRRGLTHQVEQGFPFLPSGSQIILDRQTQQLVLANIRGQLSTRWQNLVSELRGYGDVDLAYFLDESGIELADVVRSDRSWTRLRRDSGLPTRSGDSLEPALLRRVRSVGHVDDGDRPPRVNLCWRTIRRLTPTSIRWSRPSPGCCCSPSGPAVDSGPTRPGLLRSVKSAGTGFSVRWRAH